MRVNYESLPDGNSREFEVLSISTGEYGEPLPEPTVIPNGYGEGINILSSMVTAAVALDEMHGRPARYVIHDSPDTYSVEHRTARAAQVADHATFGGDMPVRLLGHSMGAPQAVSIGLNTLAGGRQVEEALLVCPNGMTPVSGPKRLQIAGEMALLTAKEITALPDLMVRVPVVRAIGRGIAARIIRSPLDAAREGGQILTQDAVPATAELHGKLLAAHGESRLRIFPGKRDGLCLGERMQQRLVDAGIPQEDITVLDIGHGDVLYEPWVLERVLGAAGVQTSTVGENKQ